jgi:ParB/RepB/Spo0J family partition protein
LSAAHSIAAVIRLEHDATNSTGYRLREHGLLQPVVVRRRGAGYELIAGRRRYAAAKVLGWTEIAAVVRDETDEQAYILTLVENLPLDDLSPREEAGALEVLVRERAWTTRQVGEAIKRSPMYVSRRLRVFDDPSLAPFVLRGELTVSTAEELLRAEPGERAELAEQAVTERWERPKVRAALAERNAALQQVSPRLASRIHALSKELTLVEPGTLSARARREAIQLLARLVHLTRTEAAN